LLVLGGIADDFRKNQVFRCCLVLFLCVGLNCDFQFYKRNFCSLRLHAL